MAVLQHVEFEGPAAGGDCAAGRGFPLRLFHLHRDTTLPLLSDFDMLTVMGGPISANDEAQLGWLGPEIALVREAIAADKTVLGICLGAQIIAKALGATVYPGTAKEIGWFPVQRMAGSHSFFDGLPDSFTPLHWHGETFDLPHEATLFANSKITKTQAFAVGTFSDYSFTWRRPRKVCARSSRCCPRNRLWRFRAAARHDPQRP